LEGLECHVILVEGLSIVMIVEPFYYDLGSKMWDQEENVSWFLTFIAP